MKMEGASNFIRRDYEACGKYQWAREFLRNAIEADASRVLFGLEWQAVDTLGVYRRYVADDGCGMDAEELKDFFSTLGAGAKRIRGVHDNFGVGAKIASLPWNPEGLVVLSFKDGKCSMIWIVLDEDTDDFNLIDFETPSGRTCVIDPTEVNWEDSGDVDWSCVAPDWIQKHGTMVILLGSEQHPNTACGNAETDEHLSATKGLSVYLNSRFWDLSHPTVKVEELRSDKPTKWPSGPDDKSNRRLNNRQARGAKYFLTGISAPNGKLAEHGKIQIDDGRVDVFWYLWEGTRPQVHAYAPERGYVATRYQDELYEIDPGKVAFRRFGVTEAAVQKNLTIVLEPRHYDTRGIKWGVHPDRARNRLTFTGSGERGGHMPMDDWGSEFADEMPDAVLEAIRAARDETAGGLENDEYRKRLQDKFGDRWRKQRLVVKETKRKKPNDDTGTLVEPTDEEIDVDVIGQGDSKPKKKRRRKRVIKVTRRVGKEAAEGLAGELLDSAVDVPRFRYRPGENFNKSWHLAMWAPNEPSGPEVHINLDSPILREMILYHQERFPPVHAGAVEETVKHVIGEIAACKIAHSAKLVSEVSEQDLDDEYRSEQALTIALMGLLAEETLIAQRLRGLGKARDIAPTQADEQAVPTT